ncbi:MAG TPA: zinc-binding dehydrogenase [Micromonosporaceae bacterium]|jgi:NADPH2:quinone reductase
MQAVWVDGFGEPEVLVARETPDPVAGAGEVVIRVAAASVTFIETAIRAGRGPRPGAGPRPPYVPGNGVAGVVVQVGAGVDEGWLGRRVASATGGTGGYASRVSAPVSELIPVPDRLDLTEAAALFADGRTATGLVELAAPQAGEVVLVLAAAGGVGTLLVQLAAPARVIGAAGGPKLSAVRDLGADAVDYTVPGWSAALPPIDVAFDGVGGTVGAEALRAVRPGGRFVMFGLSSGAPTAVDRDDVTVIGWPALSALGARSHELTRRAFANEALRPVIGQTFPLADAARAHAAIEARTTTGKTLLIPDSDR